MVEPSTKKGKGKGRRVHRRKGAEQPRVKPKQIAWTSAEQYALAKAWLDVTEDPAVANYQTSGTYWKRISTSFHRILDKPEGFRNQDSLHSKWRKIRVAIQAFNEVFTRLQSNYQSGTNDANLITNALKEFHATHNAFAYFEEWDLLRKSSKFELVLAVNVIGTRGQSSAKRSKTNSGSPGVGSSGSDARVHIDLNETDDEGEAQETRVNQVIGRDAAKRAARGGSSSSSVMTQFGEEFAMMGTNLSELVDVGKKRIEMGEKKLSLKAEKQYADDLRTLAIDTSQLPEFNRRAVEAMQRKIAEKYDFH